MGWKHQKRPQTNKQKNAMYIATDEQTKTTTEKII